MMASKSWDDDDAMYSLCISTSLSLSHSISVIVSICSRTLHVFSYCLLLQRHQQLKRFQQQSRCIRAFFISSSVADYHSGVERITRDLYWMDFVHSSRIRIFCFFFKIQKNAFLRFFEMTCQKNIENVIKFIKSLER